MWQFTQQKNQSFIRDPMPTSKVSHIAKNLTMHFPPSSPSCDYQVQKAWTFQTSSQVGQECVSMPPMQRTIFVANEDFQSMRNSVSVSPDTRHPRERKNRSREICCRLPEQSDWDDRRFVAPVEPDIKNVVKVIQKVLPFPYKACRSSKTYTYFPTQDNKITHKSETNLHIPHKINELTLLWPPATSMTTCKRSACVPLKHPCPRNCVFGPVCFSHLVFSTSSEPAFGKFLAVISRMGRLRVRKVTDWPSFRRRQRCRRKLKIVRAKNRCAHFHQTRNGQTRTHRWDQPVTRS